MTDLIQDLSTLTTVRRYNLDSMTSMAINIISHSIEESIRDCEPVTVIDIGIGTLSIMFDGSSVKYKFIPSKKLDEQVITTCKDRQSALTLKVDKALGERITNTYKDLF